jgi:hypothetical protein
MSFKRFEVTMVANLTTNMFTMPYTPQQNGCAERDNRTIVEMLRALIHAHNEIPNGLWAELANTSVYILNRTGPTTQQGKSPYESWYYKKPKISNLRIIGCDCFVHIPKQSRKRKLGKKAQKCILIGYDGDDGYRVYDKENFKMFRSRDVTFQEVPIISNSPIQDTPNHEKEKNTYEYDIPTTSKAIQTYPQFVNDEFHASTKSDEEEEVDSKDGDVGKNGDDQQHEIPIEGNKRILRDRSQIKVPEGFTFENFMADLMTKPLFKPKLTKFCEEFGLKKEEGMLRK